MALRPGERGIRVPPAGQARRLRRVRRRPRTGPPGPAAVTGPGRGQLGAVIRGPGGEVAAVPGDDLPDPVRGQGPEQVVGGDEQLAGGGPRPRVGQQLAGQIGVEPGEGPPLVHDPGPGDQRLHRGYLARERALSQPLRVGDEGLVPFVQVVHVPRALREPVGLDAGNGRRAERGRGADAELGQLADNIGGLIPRGHPEPVVERGEAEPAELLAQRVAGGPVVLGDRERDQAPHPVPRLRLPAEREDVPRSLVEYLRRALAEAHERAPADLGGDQQPVPGQAAERGPGGRVADAELREQRDQRGRRQGLGVLPPVVTEQREQEPRRALGDPPRPQLRVIVVG
jgi:hypothetical protein